MKGIIWYNNKQIGQKKFEQLIRNYERDRIGIIHLYKFASQQAVLFENGDMWKTQKANDSGIGCRCNVSLVERSIPLEKYECIIKPSTTAIPYQAIGFYGDQEGN